MCFLQTDPLFVSSSRTFCPSHFMCCSFFIHWSTFFLGIGTSFFSILRIFFEHLCMILEYFSTHSHGFFTKQNQREAYGVSTTNLRHLQLNSMMLVCHTNDIDWGGGVSYPRGRKVKYAVNVISMGRICSNSMVRRVPLWGWLPSACVRWLMMLYLGVSVTLSCL